MREFDLERRETAAALPWGLPSRGPRPSCSRSDRPRPLTSALRLHTRPLSRTDGATASPTRSWPLRHFTQWQPYTSYILLETD